MIHSGYSKMSESTGRYTGTTVVRSTAEKVLKNHGKNNSTGKFDAFVNKMHGLYKATLLDPNELEKAMEQEYQKMYESVDPMSEATGSDLYYVSGKTGDPTLSTSDPAKAVEHWFKICRGAKMMASIHTLKEKNGVDLLKWASQNHDKITAWHKKYNCPYQLDYILHGVDHAATSGRIYGFYEDPRATDAFEGDMISVFSAG